MKRLLPVTFLLFAACTDTGNTKSADGDTPVVTAADNFCFIHTDGTKAQDTTALKLFIKGDSVTGQLAYMPYEKDRATGNITGTKKGEIITALWRYTMEGMDDSIMVSFKLTPTGALQKQPAYNAQTGTMYLPDSVAYSIKYVLIDCAKFPKVYYTE